MDLVFKKFGAAISGYIILQAGSIYEHVPDIIASIGGLALIIAQAYAILRKEKRDDRELELKIKELINKTEENENAK